MEAEELEYVAFWPRVGAGLIDTLLLLTFQIPFLTVWYGASYWTDDIFLQGPADFVVSYLLPFLYTILFWCMVQATAGKMAFSARIVDEKFGTPVGWHRYVLRYLCYYLSLLPFGLGFLWVMFDPKKRGWHDRIAGTVVVRPKRQTPQRVEFESKA